MEGPRFGGDLEAVYSASLANLLHVTGFRGELAPAGREAADGAGERRDGPGAGREQGSCGPPGRRRRKTPERWVRALCVWCGLLGGSRGWGRCRPRGCFCSGTDAPI